MSPSSVALKQNVEKFFVTLIYFLNPNVYVTRHITFRSYFFPFHFITSSMSCVQVVWIKGYGHKRIVVLKNDMKSKYSPSLPPSQAPGLSPAPPLTGAFCPPGRVSSLSLFLPVMRPSLSSQQRILEVPESPQPRNSDSEWWRQERGKTQTSRRSLGWSQSGSGERTTAGSSSIL